MTSGKVLGVVTVLLALPADRLENQQTMALKGRVKSLAVTLSFDRKTGAGGKAFWQARFKAGSGNWGACSRAPATYLL